MKIILSILCISIMFFIAYFTLQARGIINYKTNIKIIDSDS